MASDEPTGTRILGALRSANGKGVVRMEDTFDNGIDEVWSALTQPEHLAHWLGELEGDLRLGGEFRATYFASGWEGTVRVQACEPPRRLLVEGEDHKHHEQHAIEFTLTADGARTHVVFEERGMPLDLLVAYGAGVQVHIEDLAAHLAGRERCDASARWAELFQAYEHLPVDAE
ncbi:MAG TPA: SRPBCC domain-containing protein [Actinocrinis sp.]|nr:SRPBCC domain-containing protein [Actinocrinis sp.]